MRAPGRHPTSGRRPRARRGPDPSPPRRRPARYEVRSPLMRRSAERHDPPGHAFFLPCPSSVRGGKYSLFLFKSGPVYNGGKKIGSGLLFDRRGKRPGRSEGAGTTTTAPFFTPGVQGICLSSWAGERGAKQSGGGGKILWEYCSGYMSKYSGGYRRYTVAGASIFVWRNQTGQFFPADSSPSPGSAGRSDPKSLSGSSPR